MRKSGFSSKKEKKIITISITFLKKIIKTSYKTDVQKHSRHSLIKTKMQLGTSKLKLH